jgi:hypothetical protein
LFPDQGELSLMNEDRFFSSYVKLCRNHRHNNKTIGGWREWPRVERRHDPKTQRTWFRVLCPVSGQHTEWINDQRKAIATWNMIIALTSKRL